MLSVSPVPLTAQVNFATLQGTVNDASGAAVPDAEVALINTATMAVRATSTNGAGEFAMPSLSPADYTITVKKAGFKTIKQTGLKLDVNQSASLNFTLEVGGTEQTIEVSASAASIETSDATMGTVIQQEEVVDLPLNGRQFTQLLQLSPGVVPIDQSQNNGKEPNFGAGAPTPSVNGQPNRSNLFIVDGIFASNPFFSGFSLSPSVDAIQEFKAQSHADQPEFGETMGSLVSVVTKSGTNSLHGSVFEFLRNGDMDARNTFAYPKLPYHQNQFGGTAGGPVKKNKLFFFAYYEGGRQVQPQPSYYTTPTAAQRAGNFSGTLATGASNIIYDPTTFNTTTYSETPFQGNLIPSSRVDPNMVTFLNANYPLPNFGSGAGPNNFLGTVGTSATGDQGSVRLDYNLSSNDAIFGRYSQGAAVNSQPLGAFNDTFQTQFNGKNTGINWIHTYTPTVVSQLTVAYNTLVIPQSTFLGGIDEGTLFSAAGLGAGFTAYPGGTAGPQTPGVGLSVEPGQSGYSGFWNGSGPIGPMATAEVAGSVSKIAGNHSLKFGAAYYKTWAYTNWAGDGLNFSYDGTWNAACQYAAQGIANAEAQCPGGLASAGGEPVASMLLSLPNSAGRTLGNSGVSLRSMVDGVFAQDSWRISPKLTFNYGVRWDYSSPVQDKDGRTPSYNMAGDYLLPQGSEVPATLPANTIVLGRKSIGYSRWGDFQPRIGLAYRLADKTVLRAGVGRVYDSWALGIQVAQDSRGAWPYGVSQNAANQDVNAQGISLKSDGSPYSGENPFSGPPVIPASPLPASFTFMDPNWQPASAFEWNVEVQQDLGKAGILSVAYVGSETEHATIQMPYDNALPSTNAVKVFPDQIWGNPANVLQSIGTARYKALQAKLVKAFTNGFTYTASFTWARSLGDGVCGDFYGSCISNEYNIQQDWGVTSLNIPVIFTFNAAYQLPFGKGKQFVNEGPGAAILGHWQINGILASRSGLPINPTCGCDEARTGNGFERYQIAGSTQGPGTTEEYFNPAAFSVPAAGTYGNAAVNALQGPKYNDVDFSLFREFLFKERAKLQFRAEFFNILNHPNYGNPSVGTSTSSITSTTGQGSRDIQMGLKLLF